MTELFEVMKQRCEGVHLISQAVDTCAEVVEDACTFRSPDPDWFDRWPSWWVVWLDGTEEIVRTDEKDYHDDWPSDVIKCLPVARKQGDPPFVGWHVVEKRS